MKKLALILASLFIVGGIFAQDYSINLHGSGSTIYNNSVNNISDIRFEGNNPANMLINTGNGTNTFALSAFDSITFVKQEEPPVGDAV